jgi:hypothetical protein
MDNPASIFVFYDVWPSWKYRGMPDTWSFVRRGLADTPTHYRYEDQFVGDISTRKIMTDYIENRFDGYIRNGLIRRYRIRINCPEPMIPVTLF